MARLMKAICPTAFFPTAVACLNIIFMVCATRINAVFFLIFTGAGLGFFLLAAALFTAAEAMPVSASLMVVSLAFPLSSLLPSPLYLQR